MRTKILSALTFCFGLSSAFKDTSPFFLSSTSELLLSTPALTSASSLRNDIASCLQQCPSDTYVIVSQPGVSAKEYQEKQATAKLRQLLSGDDKAIRSSLAVPDVKGILKSDDLTRLLQTKCGAEKVRADASTGAFTITEEDKPRIINVDFSSLPTGDGRAEKLAEHDAYLASILSLISSQKYTVLYLTTPRLATAEHVDGDSEDYEMDSIFQSTAHVELKRDLRSHKRDANITLPEGPLFERYQFLTPGLFMGLLGAILLLSILYVGISGLSSLQITYAAFDKETGPAAQRNKAQ